MGELADRYAQAFLEAGGDGAEKRAALEQNEARPVDESARGKRFSCTQLAAGVIGV